MLFDEPATGLDVHAEKEIKKVLQTLCADRTFLIITHRLHFIDLADWVIYIKDGRVVEQGTREELLGRKGEFYKFCSTGNEESQDTAKVDRVI